MTKMVDMTNLNKNIDAAKKKENVATFITERQ